MPVLPTNLKNSSSHRFFVPHPSANDIITALTTYTTHYYMLCTPNKPYPMPKKGRAKAGNLRAKISMQGTLLSKNEKSPFSTAMPFIYQVKKIIWCSYEDNSWSLSLSKLFCQESSNSLHEMQPADSAMSKALMPVKPFSNALLVLIIIAVYYTKSARTPKSERPILPTPSILFVLSPVRILSK